MNDYVIPAIARANEILSFVSKQKATFAQIAEALDVPRSSIYTLLKSLEEVGFLRKLSDGRTYTLGFRLFELGTLAAAQVDIRQAAQQAMTGLMESENLTCHLGMLDERGVFYLLKKQPANALLVNSWEGKRASLVSSGIGKALLAFLDDAELEQYLQMLEQEEGGYGRFVTREGLLAELAQIRQRGWALDDREDSPHVRCVAAPVRDLTGRVIASISVTGPEGELPDERLPPLGIAVTEAAAEISHHLGAE